MENKEVKEFTSETLKEFMHDVYKQAWVSNKVGHGSGTGFSTTRDTEMIDTILASMLERKRIFWQKRKQKDEK